MHVSGKQDFSVVVSAAEIKMNKIGSTCIFSFKMPRNVTDTGPGQGPGQQFSTKGCEIILAEHQ